MTLIVKEFLKFNGYTATLENLEDTIQRKAIQLKPQQQPKLLKLIQDQSSSSASSKQQLV